MDIKNKVIIFKNDFGMKLEFDRIDVSYIAVLTGFNKEQIFERHFINGFILNINKPVLLEFKIKSTNEQFYVFIDNGFKFSFDKKTILKFKYEYENIKDKQQQSYKIFKRTIDFEYVD